MRACLDAEERERKTAGRREKGFVRVCVSVYEREGESCVCTHEMKLHGCVACVTKSLSWMTHKEVNVHAVRELIQRSAGTH